MRTHIVALLFLAALPATALADKTATLTVSSVAFKANEAIPSEYTCEGAGLVPPLAWSTVPAATKSVAIVVEDPDAPMGTFTHWMVTDIPASTTSIEKGGTLPGDAIAAKNDKGNTGYAAPCPPSGRHHYHFRVFALDTKVGKTDTRADLMSAMKGHLLAEGELVGTYQKQATR